MPRVQRQLFISLFLLPLLTSCEDVGGGCTELCEASSASATLTLDGVTTEVLRNIFFDDAGELIIENDISEHQGFTIDKINQTTHFRLTITPTPAPTVDIQSVDYEVSIPRVLNEGDETSGSSVIFTIKKADGTVFANVPNSEYVPNNSVISESRVKFDKFYVDESPDSHHASIAGSVDFTFAADGIEHDFSSAFEIVNDASFSIIEPPIYADDGGNNSGTDNGGGSSYEFSWTCPSGSTGSVMIPAGSCQTEYENYSKIFGCNDAGAFNNAACALENCTGKPFACGAY